MITKNKNNITILAFSAILAVFITLSGAISGYGDTSKSHLAPGLDTSPICDVTENKDATISVSDNTAGAEKASHDKWMFMEMHYVVSRTLETALVSGMNSVKNVMVPLLEKEFKRIGNEGTMFLERFDIGGLEEIYAEGQLSGVRINILEGEKAGWTLRYSTQGEKGSSALIFALQDGREIYVDIRPGISDEIAFSEKVRGSERFIREGDVMTREVSPGEARDAAKEMERELELQGLVITRDYGEGNISGKIIPSASFDLLNAQKYYIPELGLGMVHFKYIDALSKGCFVLLDEFNRRVIGYGIWSNEEEGRFFRFQVFRENRDRGKGAELLKMILYAAEREGLENAPEKFIFYTVDNAEQSPDSVLYKFLVPYGFTPVKDEGYVLDLVEKHDAEKMPREEPIAADGVNVETEFPDLVRFIGARIKFEDRPIVALGTSWIKGYAKKEHMQHREINMLITALWRFCGQNNLPMVVGEDDKLLGLVVAERKKRPDAKAIILAGKSVVKSDEFKALENAVLAGVNNEELTAASYMPILDMLLTILKITFEIGDEESIMKRSKVPIEKMDGYYLFTPEARPVDYDEHRKMYEVQIFA
ncbi:MAG: hypothetical protein ABIG55_01085 [Candidatus Omnitrophota bacterium]|nr:hypothetical protein [Candidatus Omnitrophota bacterium]